MARILRKNPFFIEIGDELKIGTFIRFEESGMSDQYRNIVWTPIGWGTTEHILKNVPMSAIVNRGTIMDPLVPRDGAVITLAGEDGNATFLKKYINPMIGDVFKFAAESERLRAYSDAAKRSSEEESLKEHSRLIEKQLEIQKKLNESKNQFFALMRYREKLRTQQNEGEE